MTIYFYHSLHIGCNMIICKQHLVHAGQTSATTVEMTSNPAFIGVERNVAYGEEIISFLHYSRTSIILTHLY